MIKRCFLIYFLFMFYYNAQSQIPQTMSYQGILAGTDGEPVTDANYQITFKLYDDTLNTAAIWEENQTVAVINGLFNAILGSNNPLALPFNRPYWLGITIGAENELTPRLPLAASPYALSS